MKTIVCFSSTENTLLTTYLWYYHWLWTSFNLNYTLFYRKHFYKQRQAEIGIKQMLSSTLRLNFCFFKIVHIILLSYHPKIIGHIIKNKQENKCVSFYVIIQLIIKKIKMEMKYKSHRYDINRPRSRHEHKFSKYKKCRNTMMFRCVKQHLSNIWHSIHEKSNNTDAELLKSASHKKSVIPQFHLIFSCRNFVEKHRTYGK